MSDWGSVYGSGGGGGSGSGGGGWGSVYGGGGGAAHASSGGGGLFDSIGGFLGHELGRIPGEHAVAAGLGGAAYTTKNLASGVGSTISALPELPGALVKFNRYDAKHYPLTLNPAQAWREITQSYHDPHSIGGGAVRPTVESSKNDLGNIIHLRTHELAKNPLSPLLTLASIASVGGVAALKGAKFADEANLVAKGGRISRLANDSARTISDAAHVEEFPRARTIQGRLRQNAFDRYSMANPDRPVVGSQARLVAKGGTHSYYRTQAEMALTRQFQRAGKPLTKAEEFATHIAAEPIPYRDRIALYAKLNAENPSNILQKYIAAMKNPDVAKALTNPRPEFAQFTHEAKALEQHAGQTLVDAGKLTPEIRAERAMAPLNFAREHGIIVDGIHEPPNGIVGARSVPDAEGANVAHVELHPTEPLTYTEGGVARRTNQHMTFGEFMHWDGRGFVTGLHIPPGLRSNRQLILDLRDQIVHQMNTSGIDRFVPDPNGLTRDGEAVWKSMARRIEQGKMPGWRVVGKAERGDVTGDMAAGGATRELNGQFFERTESRAINDIHPSLATGFRFPHVGTTGNPSLFRTPLGKLAGPKVPGMLKKSRLARFARGQFITNPQAVYSEDWMRSARYLHELDQQDHMLTPASRALDPKLEDTYGKPQDGFYYWPAKAQARAKAMNLPGRSGMPRHLREADARAADLQDLGVLDTGTHQAGVEAAAKSTVSDSLQGLGLEGKTIKQLDELGVRWLPKAYGQAYQREFGRANAMVRLLVDKPTSAWRSATLKYRPAWAVNNMLGQHLLYAMANPTLGGATSYAQAALGHARNADTYESIPGMRQGFATTQKGITHTGGAQALVDRSATLKAARAMGLPFKAVAYPIKKFGDGIQKLNQLGENVPREAQFLHLAKDKLDLTNQTLAEAVRTADPKVIQRLVDEVNSLQGDFGHMSHFERTVMRRILPFYSWFKVITKLTGTYVARYPARVKMLQAMSNFLNEPNAKMPSYLQGFIHLFDKGGEVTGLSTVGANPFQTIPQLLSAAGGLIHGKPTFGTSNPGGLLNPGLQAIVTGLSGTDNFTGNAYRGPGANQGALGRAAGSFFASLPEYRLAEQATGLGPQSSLYSQQHFAGLPPYLWNYLGLPIRRVKKPEAASRAKAGQ